MSIPWWYEQAQALCRRPPRVGEPRKIDRGSPKLPRTGCCWSKGLTGQPYECARSAELRAGEAAVEFCVGRAVLPARAPPPIAAARRKIAAKRRCAPRWICVLVG